jgi:hypothetical protein
MDSKGAATSEFAQMTAVTTYARNEQVRGSIPRGGSNPDQRKCVGQVLLRRSSSTTCVTSIAVADGLSHYVRPCSVMPPTAGN